MLSDSPVAGVVLGGGLSTRIGEDKGNLQLGGQTLSLRTLARLNKVFKELVYVTNTADLQIPLRGVTLAWDEVPHMGPLGGILAGLRATAAPRIFVAAFDMPFLSTKLIEFLVDYDVTADVTVPNIDGQHEPLHAIYSQKCEPAIVEALAQGRRQIIAFYQSVKVTVVPEAEIDRLDPRHLSFFNINTWSDIARAKKILAANADA